MRAHTAQLPQQIAIAATGKRLPIHVNVTTVIYFRKLINYVHWQTFKQRVPGLVIKHVSISMLTPSDC